MTFAKQANADLINWRHRTPALADLDPTPAPYSQRPDGPTYAFCLPLDHAQRNLLPEARDVALDRFRRLRIRWHDGWRGAPSNHLRDSQVQCVNALMPLVHDPDSLAAAFGAVLPIESVLPFEDPAVPDDRVVFEWIGLRDYLNESTGKPRTRGADATSADAAIRYRTPDGDTEIALIEWKYTESYATPHPTPNAAAHAVRRTRYEGLWGSVVRTDVLELEDLFTEPIYQLLRLQMLANEMERTKELGADRVRLVYAAPAANLELWSSLPTPALAGIPTSDGRRRLTDVRDVWNALVLEPDRFVWLDTASFVSSAAPTSDEFKHRYAHLDGARTRAPASP